MSTLIIVESPAKAKKIRKMFPEYKVEASMGHIRNVARKNSNSIELDNNFKINFTVIDEKKDTVEKLKKIAENSTNIILAPDPDREGEAIAWHLKEVLELKEDKYKRITFNAITKSKITEALNNPAGLNNNMVNSALSRFTLDWIVGYRVSPILWRLNIGAQSAGRVQSIAVKIVTDREKEITSFVPEQIWVVNGTFNESQVLKIFKIGDEKIDQIKDQIIADKVKNDIKEGDIYKVISANISEKTRSPKPPYKTSTLQQDSSNILGISTSETMKIAQFLYENGHITYMRTDSERISPEGIDQGKSWILNTYGEEFIGDYKEKKSKNKVQDGHECIRPTDVNKNVKNLKFNNNQLKVYKLIWTKFISALMSNMQYNQLETVLQNDIYQFKGTINSMVFLGYKKLDTTEKEDFVDLPEVNKGDEFTLTKIEVKESKTKAKPRYTEASLVKILEKEGIGRPSTYASIIQKIQDRSYVTLDNSGKNKKKQYFSATELGIKVSDFLEKGVPDIMKINFTSLMEKRLDEIEEGTTDKDEFLDKFWKYFKKKLDNINIKGVYETKPCPKCKGTLFLKKGTSKSTGKDYAFFSCENWKSEGDLKCDYTENYK